VPVAPDKTHPLHNVLAYRRILREVRPDLLLTYNWGTIEWAAAKRLTTIPHIHVEDGFGPEEANEQIPRRALARRFLLRRSTVVVPSYQLRNLATNTWRLTPHHIPNGINPEHYAGERKPHDQMVVGTIAMLRAEKNLSRLLHAFRFMLNYLP